MFFRPGVQMYYNNKVTDLSKGWKFYFLGFIKYSVVALKGI